MAEVIGTGLGTVYANDQGKGLATILDPSAYLKAQALRHKAAADDKDRANKQKADALKKLEDKRPDVKWPEYLNQLKEGYNRLYEVSAEHITANNVDPWTSVDPTSKKIRGGFNNLNNATDRVNALYTEYQKRIEDIHTRGDKYTQDSIDTITNFTDVFDVNDMMRGYKEVTDPKTGKVTRRIVEMPQLEFKNPTTLFTDLHVKGVNHLRQFSNDLGVIPKDKIITFIGEYASDPINEGNVKAADQSYQKLDPNSKYAKEVRSYAAQNGFGGEYGLAMQAMSMDRLLNKKDFNIIDIARDAAKSIPLDTIVRRHEDIAGVTKGTKVTRPADKNASANEAFGILTAHPELLQNETVLAQLGVDRNTSGSPQETYDAALTGLTRLIEDNIPRVSESTIARESGGRYGGLSKKEFEDTFDDWWSRITSGNQQIANEAASWPTNIKMPGTEGVIQDVEVRTNTGQFGKGDHALMVIRMKDEKSAKTAQEKFFKAIQTQIPDDVIGEEARNEWLRVQNELITSYRIQTAGKAVVVPLNDGTYQQMKTFYHQVSKSSRPYESKWKDKPVDVMGFFDKPKK